MSTVGLVVGNPKAQSRTLALAEAGRRAPPAAQQDWTVRTG